MRKRIAAVDETRTRDERESCFGVFSPRENKNAGE